VLDDLLGPLDDGWTHHHPADGEWSAHDVLGHFVHDERTDWIPPGPDHDGSTARHARSSRSTARVTSPRRQDTPRLDH
jgi:hypothetical protein